MRLQVLVLPTSEVLNANREIFAALPGAGIPLITMTQYLLDSLVLGDAQPLTCQELLEGWREYASQVVPMNERVVELLTSDAFGRAFYALYRALHDVQEALLTPSTQGWITSIHHRGWQGQDLVVERELCDFTGSG